MTTPLDCQDVVELLTDYLDGALDEQLRVAVEAHLAECDGCDAYLDQLRATRSALGILSAPDLPDELVPALLSAFRAFRR